MSITVIVETEDGPTVLEIEAPEDVVVTVAEPAPVIVATIAEQGPAGPAGFGIPEGGIAGQFIRKRSGTDYDVEWSSEIKAPIIIDGGLL